MSLAQCFPFICTDVLNFQKNEQELSSHFVIHIILTYDCPRNKKYYYWCKQWTRLCYVFFFLSEAIGRRSGKGKINLIGEYYLVFIKGKAYVL